jgi:hypothetical protein
MSLVVYLTVLGVSIMLGQVAADVSAQLPFRVSGVIVPLLSAIVGGWIALLGQFLLQ